MFNIYKTTNNLNGKFYIGVSNGNNMYYKGSGTALKKAIKKYGGENFVTEILETFDNEDDMFIREAEIVNKEFVANRNTYNLKLGGRGGKGTPKSLSHCSNISKAIIEKKKSGTLISNGGRKSKMPPSELLALVKQHGIVETAKLLGESYNTFRSRYYTAKKNLTSK